MTRASDDSADTARRRVQWTGTGGARAGVCSTAGARCGVNEGLVTGYETSVLRAHAGAIARGALRDRLQWQMAQ
jgi:hypothetical protein